MTIETIDFTGTDTDPWPSGFTFDRPGGTEIAGTIQSNRGRVSTTVGGRDMFAVRTADSLSESDVTMVMASTNAVGGSGLHIGLLSRYTSASVCYRARGRYDTGTVELTRNGTQVGTFQVNGGGGFDATWRVRLRTTVSGSDALVQVRYWEASASEPGTWDIEYTDTAPLSAGKCGIFADIGTNTLTVDVDDYVRDDLAGSGATPTPAVIAATVALPAATVSAGFRHLPPDAVLASTALTGATVANLDEDPASADADWAVATSNNVATDARVSFSTPPGTIATGAGLQVFRAVVRKTGTSGTGTPLARLELWEAGVLV